MTARLLCAALLALAPLTARAQAASPLPAPYEADEFPAWAASLRRWEIVSLGAFPLALFYTRMAFDFSRYVDSGFQAIYTPWPFKNEYSYNPSDAEQRTAFLTAMGVALAVGIADAVILRLRDKAGP